MKNYRKLYFPLAAVILILLDQLSKQWIVNHIPLNAIRKCVPGIFSLTYLRNYGAAFSILQNQQWFFTVITLAVVGAACYYFIKNINGNFWFLFGLLLIISGGIGNFIDRLRLGYVIDMVHLDFMNFAIFNVADSYLTVGVMILFIALWKEEENGINH
ncbi:lipoprotein signal peptidase [Streptococcus infantarius subsp. infantarius]|uniref:signal peptidase II n=1 Tax=uncultured Streptococcus sp. TaxID=83427 RepID=UPI00208F104A|nr:signal peptidase II [uncultured Streptococcus sp.]MCO4542611.1 lipoprotein signal peptidase [Streptococcus infantarius subsp. infantarius]MCO4548714.1 lipoprotein signal peptidase [Streptococcus infantarius subsp. infantarius]MCO4552285.1 lipoprotein signal peptidase [Streptococcus infantarius subsp. infantarius]MCO4557832.1 lipoprotein signal peptidase [Streptococcus infantarius subsp. infantarius]MCO4559882.1 lipoprotein signal peptidase [Streptococcus infantarius subsp. infantarius]